MSLPSVPKRNWRSLLGDGILFGGALIVTSTTAFLLWYAGENGSGHTALNPYALWYGAIPACIVGVVARLTASFTVSKSVANILLVASAFTIALPVYFEHTDVLRQYGGWTDAEMPSLSTRTLMLRLAIFATLFAGTLIWSAYAPFWEKQSGHQKGARMLPP